MIIRFEAPVLKLRLCDIFLSFYAFILLGNQQDEGLDALLLRFSFALMVGYFFCVEFLFRHFVIELKNFKVYIWFLVFSVYSMMSSLWAIQPSYVFNLIPQYIQCFGVLCFILTFYQSVEDVERLMLIIVLASIYCIVIVLLRSPGGILWEKRLGSAAAINPNSFGCFMAVSFCISFYKAEKQKEERLLWLILCIVFACFSIASGSKKAFFSILLCLFVYPVSSGRISLKKIIALFGSCIAIVLLACFCFYYEPAYNILGSRIQSFLNEFLYDEMVAGSSTSKRAFLIEEAKMVFLQNPLIGIGLNNFTIAIQDSTYVAYTHNNYWELLSTLGIFGFLLYYCFEFSLIKGVGLVLQKPDNGLCSFVISLISMKILIDYGMVTFYKPFFIMVLMLLWSCVRTLTCNDNFGSGDD